MYTDRMSVERSNKVVENKITKNVYNFIYTDIPCRISLEREDQSNNENADIVRTSENNKVFCDPKYILEKGDRITVTRYNEDGEVIMVKYAYIGRPYYYKTHVEFLLEMSEKA